ncbi:hypothetical protein CONLIGDRAFT_332899 [Coniochaeta ligniaria NRRL 30616]|uniref:Urease accessory protein UreF n=1 Tax=Coniochaeta ligniaria NRRL 30616 TaxID=1408157 RepID=A0A1J7JIF9_9PEZI|nr:hypothetical protein CONLIGDRAFT_332899 [Coniochaeta ligniaria NRRL 30616]
MPTPNGEELDNDDGTQSKINELEAQLAQLRWRQQQKTQPESQSHHDTHSRAYISPHIPTFSPATHFLLLLSDSALPLGSFAFSSGLESFLAHTTRTPTPPPQLFTTTFLPLSISSYASTTLPFVLASHADPALLPVLDDALDAATICTVGRRASVAQGRALLGIWERSFSPTTPDLGTTPADTVVSPLLSFAAELRSAQKIQDDALPPAVSAHLPPLFGAVCRAAGLDAQQTALVFMLNHVKALVSAAVRRGMFGPYQAQKILASQQVRETVEAVVRREWDTPYYEAGQSVPVMDLWVGRHEMLYSRIFNS